MSSNCWVKCQGHRINGLYSISLVLKSHWLFESLQFSGLKTNRKTMKLLVHSAAAAAKSLQSCPTLCNPIDGSPPGSPVPGILQARTLEWFAISLSNAWKWKVKVKSLSRVWLFTTRWTVAYQAPLSLKFSRQEYWSGLPLPSPVHSDLFTLYQTFLTENFIVLLFNVMQIFQVPFSLYLLKMHMYVIWSFVF